jgi:hypothetical protein
MLLLFLLKFSSKLESNDDVDVDVDDDEFRLLSEVLVILIMMEWYELK